MNTPNPLIPQGSLPDSRGKSHVRIAVFTILAIHVVLLGALLMAGCKKTSNDQTAANAGNPPVDNASAIPPLQDSNATPVAPPGNTAVPPPGGNSFAQNQNQVTPPPAATPPAPLPTNPNPTPSAPPVAPPPTDAGTATATSGEHVIVKGDTFANLAKHYNTTTKAITDANPGVQASKLKIGQKIKIPAATGGTAAPGGATGVGATGTATTGGETVHVVKNNDSLWALAKKYGVSQNAIKTANNLKTSSLKVGQKLKIPAKSGGAAAPAPEASPAPAPSTPAPTPGPAGAPAQ